MQDKMEHLTSVYLRKKEGERMATLIIIRGNSGSGKTTLAKKLQKIVGGDQLLVSQDLVRRQLFHVRDTLDNPAIALIEQLVIYGLSHCSVVILEGILAKEKYGSMLTRIQKKASRTFVYYYDLSLEETMLRHQQKAGVTFSIDKLADWFLPNDVLGVNNEKIIEAKQSLEATVQSILIDAQEL